MKRLWIIALAIALFLSLTSLALAEGPRKAGGAAFAAQLNGAAPVVTITAPANGAFYTSENVPAAAFTVTDDDDPAPTVTQMGYSTVEGVRVFVVTATDQAGNIGSAQVVYTVDNTAPLISLNLGTSMCFQEAPNPNDLFDAFDNLDPLFQVKTETTGGPCHYTLTITTQDAAGNVAARSVDYIIDPQAPVIQIAAPLDGAVYNPTNLPAGAFVVSDNCDANPIVIETGWSSAEGAHIYTVTATDCAGNVRAASVSYTVDATPPAPAHVIAADAPGLGADPAQAGELTLLGVAEDGARLQMWARRPGAVDFAFDGAMVADDCGHWQYTFLFGDVAGNYAFKVGSRDLAGNWSWSDEFTLALDPAVAIETVALQQGVEIAGVTYEGAADAWIGAWQPAANAGDDTRLKVRYGEEHNALVKFDLAEALPNGANVELATLSLYNTERSNANPLNIELFGLQAAWAEDEATFTDATAEAKWEVAGANGAADRDQAASDAVWTAWDRSWYTFGVTGLARAWAADPSCNQGVALRGAADVSVEYDFASSEYPDLCRRPLLVVIYSSGAPLELAQ